MAALIEAINIKRRTVFEFENAPVLVHGCGDQYADGSRGTDIGAPE